MGLPSTNPHSPGYKGGKLHHYNKLNPRHQNFVLALIDKNYNQTQAYLEAYPECSYESAPASASRLLTDDKIKAAIRERRMELEAKTDISFATQIHRLMGLAEEIEAVESPTNRASLKLKIIKELNLMAGHTLSNKPQSQGDVTINVDVVGAKPSTIIQDDDVTDVEFYTDSAPLDDSES